MLKIGTYEAAISKSRIVAAFPRAECCRVECNNNSHHHEPGKKLWRVVIPCATGEWYILAEGKTRKEAWVNALENLE